MSLKLESPAEVLKALGQRAQRLRQLQSLKQTEVAQRAGVGVATLKRFESSGRTSLENALRIAFVLGAEEGFGKLFAAPPYASIDDALSRRAGGSRRVRKP